MIPSSVSSSLSVMFWNKMRKKMFIILLSLVRSNRKKSAGFLKESNRVCVALSRARYGLYCIGNFQLFQVSCEFWSSIVDDLKSRGILGDSLELVCSRHKIVTKVSRADDFEKVPDGGCDLPCIAFYTDCGHKCPRNATQTIKITNHLVSTPARNYFQIVNTRARKSAMKNVMKNALS